MIWYNNCFHLNATILALFITVGVGTDVNNKKVFSFAVGMQQCVLFALLSSCKIFRTVVINNKHYTGCNRRNGPDFGRMFLMLNYTEKPQNTYIQSSMVTEI